MPPVVKITAEIRQKAAPAVRREAHIPGVLYGHGLKSQSVQVPAKEFTKILGQAGETSLVTLTFNEKEHPVIIREVQYHPLKGTIQHVDFYQVRMDEVIEAEVPITFVGEAAAVKDLSGVLVRNLDELAVEALPKDLPHAIEVNIASLDTFEKVIRLKDIILPEGVKTAVDGETVIALVQAPRSEAELEALKEEVKQEDVQKVEGMKTKAEQEKEKETAAAGDKTAAPPEATKKEEKKEKK